MSRPRKTIEVAKVVEIANRMLEASNDDKAEGRTAVALRRRAQAGCQWLGARA